MIFRRGRGWPPRATVRAAGRLLPGGTPDSSDPRGAPLIGCETVKQTGATGAAECGLAAAAALSARGMRGVPGFRGRILGEPHAVMVADHGCALAAAGPVAAGPILAGREGGAVRLRAGQDVVHVGLVA